MGKPAVTGANTIIFDKESNRLMSKDEMVIVSEGDVICIDGSTGLVYKGPVPTVRTLADTNFQTVLNWCDKYKRLRVLANVDNVEEVEKAAEFQAEGIGMCRMEHLLFQENRIKLFRKVLFAETKDEKQSWLDSLAPLLRQDFLEIYRLMRDKQVIVRLIDTPISEFLPDPTSSNFSQNISELCRSSGMHEDQCKSHILQLQEMNPVMGFRGCRLSVVFPELVEMQAKALIGNHILLHCIHL
jgi:pyruvate, orthophosphate dikinase